MRIASILLTASLALACSKHDDNNSSPPPPASATAESTPADTASGMGEGRHHHHHDGGFGRWRRDHDAGDLPIAPNANPSAP